MTKAVTINLDDARAAELERIAREHGVSIDEVVGEAIDLLGFDDGQALPPLTVEEEAKIDRSIALADRGQVVSQDEVETWLKRRFGK